MQRLIELVSTKVDFGTVLLSGTKRDVTFR